jgi:hypothetical protein
MTTALAIYTPPALAIVPVAPATTQREATYRRKPAPKTYYMSGNWQDQCWTHESLLRSGWTPIKWEIVA